MLLYTALIEYNSCIACSGTGVCDGRECKQCHNSWGSSHIFQVEANDLDTAIGKIKYQLTLSSGFEDDVLSADDAVEVGNSKNVWFLDVLDKKDRFFMIYIVLTENTS